MGGGHRASGRGGGREEMVLGLCFYVFFFEGKKTDGQCGGKTERDERQIRLAAGRIEMGCRTAASGKWIGHTKPQKEKQKQSSDKCFVGAQKWLRFLRYRE